MQNIDNFEQVINDDPGLELLVSLAQDGQVDPWDIDLEKITSKYLQAISTNPSDNLKEAGRAIFYASVLLRMKSDLLVHQSQEALNIGLHKEFDSDFLLQEELKDHAVRQISFGDLESALRRKYLQKAKRFRKLTLTDLIAALQEAKSEEEARVERKQQKLFDLDSYSIVAPELSDDILDLTHSENLESAIERLQTILQEHLLDGNGLPFTQIVKALGSWSNAFLSVLFLAHEAKINIDQKDFYGDLWIYESAK